MSTASNANMIRCDACSSLFHFGPHAYRGTYIPTYKVTVCESCYRVNLDGWAPHLEQAITAKLREFGTEFPARNPAGLLPRD